MFECTLDIRGWVSHTHSFIYHCLNTQILGYKMLEDNLFACVSNISPVFLRKLGSQEAISWLIFLFLSIFWAHWSKLTHWSASVNFDRGIWVSMELNFYKFRENQWLNKLAPPAKQLCWPLALCALLGRTTQDRSQPETELSCAWLRKRSWDWNWDAMGCWGRSMWSWKRWWTTAFGERTGGSKISVTGTWGRNASHFSSCLQEACFFHWNTL